MVLTDDELKLKIKVNDSEEELKPQENALSVVHSFLFRKAMRSNRESLIRCLFSQL